jgi:hypothetical protein
MPLIRFNALIPDFTVILLFLKREREPFPLFVPKRKDSGSYVPRRPTVPGLFCERLCAF